MQPLPQTSVRSEATMSAAIRGADNYHDWVFETFRRFLRRGTALEIGSGHGAYSRRIAACVERVIVSDIDPAAIAAISRELSDVPNVTYEVMDGVDTARLAQPVQNVILVNVIEHIADDEGLMRRCRDVLDDDGIVAVFAPAFPLLYSRMDREAGHVRRYRKQELQRLLHGAGFDILALRYVNAIGFFGWLANKLSRSGLASRSTNAQIELFDGLVPLVKYVDRVVPFIGQSLVAVGRRSR